MSGVVVYLPSVEWVEFCLPAGAPPGGELIPLVVDDDAQAAVEIYKGDIVIVDASRRPGGGEFGVIQTMQHYLLGYITARGEKVYVEPVCGCGGGKVEEFPSGSVLSYGKVIGVCGRRCRGVDYRKPE